MTDPLGAKEAQLNMAKLSWIAYQAPDDVDRWWQSCQSKPEAECGNWSPLKTVAELPRYATCSSCDANAYAFKLTADGADPLVLACRGTDSIRDALVDVSLELVPFEFANGEKGSGVYVHAGFYEQFKAILPQVDSLYKGHLAGGGFLVCTGHSLGSAVAALAALFYAEQYPEQVAYIGFGTPRVGNFGFANRFNSVVLDRTRIANGRDPVNKVPPPVDYKHVGTETHIGRRDPYPAIPVLTDLPDHDILLGYINNLESDGDATAVPKKHSNWLIQALCDV